MTIRRQFTLVLAFFSIALATLFGIVSYQVAKTSLESELDRRLIWIAGGAAEVGLQGAFLLTLRPGQEDLAAWTGPHYSLSQLRNYVDAAWVFDATTLRAIVTSEDPDSIPIGTPLPFLEPYEAEIEEALTNGVGSTTRLFPGSDGRFYKYGFKQLEQTTAMIAVQAPADFVAPLRRLRTLIIAGALLSLLLAVVLGNLLAANFARPLEGLSRAALRIQRGHMDHKVELDRADELGRLANAMERMRVGIQERDEQLRLMLAQVAHEIRNPLGGLELFASAASDAETPEERNRIIGRIRDEVNSLNRIIGDFLGYARPTPVDLEPTDIRIAIEAAAHLSAAGDGTEVEVQLATEPLLARADQDQIKRLVLNLIRNAAAVSSRVVASAEMEKGEVVIRVADDGPGVRPSMRKRIFEPFVTDKEQGAGLGLAIVRKVADAHGGRVEVGDAIDSGLGTGAEFRVYLPGFEDFGVLVATGDRRSASS